MNTLKLYFLLPTGRKNCRNLFFLLQMVKKKKCLLYWSLLLCTADCADTRITFHILIFCWKENLQGALKWMGRVSMSIKRSAATGRFRETSVFRLHVPLGRKWVPTTHWCCWCLKVFMSNPDSRLLNLGISKVRGHYTGTMYLSPVWLLRPSRCWVWSMYNPTQAQVTTMFLISTVKPRTAWVKPWKKISQKQLASSALTVLVYLRVLSL